MCARSRSRWGCRWGRGRPRRRLGPWPRRCRRPCRCGSRSTRPGSWCRRTRRRSLPDRWPPRSPCARGRPSGPGSGDSGPRPGRGRGPPGADAGPRTRGRARYRTAPVASLTTSSPMRSSPPPGRATRRVSPSGTARLTPLSTAETTRSPRPAGAAPRTTSHSISPSRTVTASRIPGPTRRSARFASPRHAPTSRGKWWPPRSTSRKDTPTVASEPVGLTSNPDGSKRAR